MFRPTCRSSSPFSLTDLDMWDTKSRFTAQSSAWCGMAAVSGSGFLSKVNTSTSGSTSGFRQNGPGMRRWQSLSYLAPEGAPRSFPGAELQAAQGESSYRQSELMEWMRDVYERLDTQLDLLKSRDAQLNYNISTAQLLDMKHKQAEAMSALEQENEAAELSPFEKSWQRRELREKFQQMEKDLLQMRSTLNRGSHVQSVSPKKTSVSLSTLPMNQEDLNIQEKQKSDTELCKLRAALIESEARAKTQEEERNNALQKLQTSTEVQRTLLNQMEEMIQRLNNTMQNHSDVQEQLSEANNKISQACLEKAILSTQVLKLEDNIKELKASFSGALSDKEHLIQEEKADLQQREKIQQGSESCELHVHQADSHNSKQETVLMKEETKSLREVNEKLTCELEMVKQRLEMSQSQLQELTSEKVMNTKQIADLKAERSQLITEREELLIKINDGHRELTDLKEKCHQLGESLEALELEKQKLQDSCLSLEDEVLAKEEKLHQQEDEYQRQDAARVQKIEELRAVASNWTEKWQKVALTLQSTQEEIEELKKNNSRNKNESDLLLRVELEACKQELELERTRGQALFQDKGKGGEAVQTQDKGTVTDLNISSQTESSLLWNPPSVSSSQNKSAQRVKKASGDNQDEGGLTSDTLRAQLEESRRKANHLEEEKTLAVQRLQTLRQLYPAKDENSSVDGRKYKTVSPVNVEVDQQRRMVTEQLKSLFKEREAKEIAQTGARPLQDWTPSSNNIKSAVERRSWHQGSGLMPVFEEDEESDDWSGREEGELAEEAQTETNIHSQSLQMSTMSAEINNLKTKNDNLLQAIRLTQPIRDFPATAEKDSDKSSDVGVPSLSHFSDEINLQRRSPFLYPDGIFLAELVDICSPDEEGEDED
ncbi:putative leucine-rich repeat-containing protein DDB_G0290503 isoform X2 [Thunnus thynnus]|uniref:putative leucine-rich repeat-containing protein DDB_G0290503 isoform X2 n=1 Tax=Thunnus thynnus TaxID=8237 RepID=UPI0035291080